MDSNDFQIKPINSYFCDLKLLEIKTKKDGSIVEEFGDSIYGIPFLIAICTITTHRTSKQFKETSMKEFLKVWQQEFIPVRNEVCALRKSLD